MGKIRSHVWPVFSHPNPKYLVGELWPHQRVSTGTPLPGDHICQYNFFEFQGLAVTIPLYIR